MGGKLAMVRSHGDGPTPKNVCVIDIENKGGRTSPRQHESNTALAQYDMKCSNYGLSQTSWENSPVSSETEYSAPNLNAEFNSK